MRWYPEQEVNLKSALGKSVVANYEKLTKEDPRWLYKISTQLVGEEDPAYKLIRLQKKANDRLNYVFKAKKYLEKAQKECPEEGLSTIITLVQSVIRKRQNGSV